jgi:hypothetical protein
MLKIIVTESQLKSIIPLIINETQDEIRLDKVQNFIKILKDSGYYDPSVVNKYMSRIMKLPFSDVLKDFAKEFNYNISLVDKVINKKRNDLHIRKGEDPFGVRTKTTGSKIDTSFDSELDLDSYISLLNQTVGDEKIKKYLINNIFNPKFFSKLNLVLDDFYPRYNKMKEEYQSTKRTKPFNEYTIDDFNDFVDPFTGERLVYDEQDLMNEKTKPVLKGDVIFKNAYTYALSNQLIYAKNILKNVMTHDINKHQLIDHTIRSVNRYLSDRNIDPELRGKGRPRS